MKVLLVNPYFDSHIITPPLGLGYISAYIKAKCPGIEVSIIDCLARNMGNDRLIKFIAGAKPDLIGLSVYSTFYAQVREIIRDVKKLDNNIKVAIGGPHVSALPSFSLEDTLSDFAICGEGEETFAELINQLSSGANDYSAINGLCFRDSGNAIKVNPPRKLIEDLNTLDWPDWKEINPAGYPAAPHGGLYKRFPVAPLITTRGCPFGCKFCGTRVTWRGSIRYRNKLDVVDEMEFLVKDYGVREFHFEDDNFTFERSHAYGICREIIKRKLDIVWACPNGVRIDTIDDDLLEIMKMSGCYLLAFGIESGSQDILDSMGKRLDKAMVSAVVRKTRDAGIETWGFFIIGLPGENRQTVRESIDFAKRLPLDRAQFCNFVPIPGTPLFDSWVKGQNFSSLKDIKWEDLNFYGRSTHTFSHLDVRDIAKLQKKAFMSFYGRPRIILKLISKVKLRQIAFLSRRFKEYILK